MKPKTFFAFIMMSLCALSSFAQPVPAIREDAATRKKHFNLDGDVAIDGYDPVAYLKNNKALEGDKNLAVYHQGIIYYFSNVENKEEFKKNPSKYEPEYGGWCAYAMGAKGEKVSIDPETFKILNGKLYLFYNKRFNNTLKSWNKDETSLKTKADASWQKIFH
jgi:YHS domain-containing protein